MGYARCEIHDQDATNGCASCWREELDGMTDADVLRSLVVIEEWPGSGATRDRLERILRRFEGDVLPTCKHCGETLGQHRRRYCFRGKLYDSWPELFRVLNETQGIAELHEFAPPETRDDE